MSNLGIIESRGIAAGVKLADLMVKCADVNLVRSGTICSGRYLILVSGERDAVETSVKAAEESGCSLAGSCVLSGISPQVTYSLRHKIPAVCGDAVGVVESRTVTAGILAADLCVKRSMVNIARFVAGQGINGKSYFVVSGDVGSVTEAVKALEEENLGRDLLDTVVIPSPDPLVTEALTGLAR